MKKKKIISLLIAFAMVFNFIPFGAFTSVVYAEPEQTTYQLWLHILTPGGAIESNSTQYGDEEVINVAPGDKITLKAIAENDYAFDRFEMIRGESYFYNYTTDYKGCYTITMPEERVDAYFYFIPMPTGNIEDLTFQAVEEGYTTVESIKPKVFITNECKFDPQKVDMKVTGDIDAIGVSLYNGHYAQTGICTMEDLLTITPKKGLSAGTYQITLELTYGNKVFDSTNISFTVTEPKYTMTVDLNGGTAGPNFEASGEIDANTTGPILEVPASFATPPEGKVFDALEINGVRYEVGSEYTITEDANVKILWKSANTEKYKVEFVTDGGSEIATQLVAEGEYATRPETDPTKEGYIFCLWCEDSEHTGEFEFERTPITEDTKVYALWVQDYHDVTVNMQGKTNVEDMELEHLLALELLLEDEVLTYKEFEDEDKAEIYNKDGKLLFTVDEEGTITVAEGLTYEDNIEYTLTDEDKEMIEDVGFFYINKITLNFGDAPEAYKILEGADQTHKLDSKDSLIVKANGDISKLLEIRVDKVKLDKDQYELKEGSTIVTLKPAYLNTLKEGEHELTLVYNDGEVSTNFTIAKAEEAKSPKTGDPIAFWTSMLIISSLGLFVATKDLRKKY